METLYNCQKCKEKFPFNKKFLHELKCKIDPSVIVKHEDNISYNKKVHKINRNSNINNIKPHLKRMKYRHKSSKFQFHIKNSLKNIKFSNLKKSRNSKISIEIDKNKDIKSIDNKNHQLNLNNSDNNNNINNNNSKSDNKDNYNSNNISQPLSGSNSVTNLNNIFNIGTNNYYRFNQFPMDMNYRNINSIPMNMNTMSTYNFSNNPINNLNNQSLFSKYYGNPINMNYMNPININNMNSIYMNNMTPIYMNNMNQVPINGMNSRPMNYLNSMNMKSPFMNWSFKANNIYPSFKSTMQFSSLSPILSHTQSLTQSHYRDILLPSNSNSNIISQNKSNSNKDLEQKLINNLPETKIKDVSKLTSEKKNCVICLEDFVKDEYLTCLPCFHPFHSKCIKDWLKRSKDCPICKFKITNESLNYQ